MILHNFTKHGLIFFLLILLLQQVCINYKQFDFNSTIILPLHNLKCFFFPVQFTSFIYQYTLFVFVCLFVCIQYRSKRLNRSGPNFVWDLMWPQGRFMNDQNFKNLCWKGFSFCKILKMHEKILWNPQTIFSKFLYCTKRRCTQIKPKLKVEIEDAREAP